MCWISNESSAPLWNMYAMHWTGKMSALFEFKAAVSQGCWVAGDDAVFNSSMLKAGGGRGRQQCDRTRIASIPIPNIFQRRTTEEKVNPLLFWVICFPSRMYWIHLVWVCTVFPSKYIGNIWDFVPLYRQDQEGLDYLVNVLKKDWEGWKIPTPQGKLERMLLAMCLLKRQYGRAAHALFLMYLFGADA